MRLCHCWVTVVWFPDPSYSGRGKKGLGTKLNSLRLVSLAAYDRLSSFTCGVGVHVVSSMVGGGGLYHMVCIER